MLKVGVVGLGMGRWHLQNYSKLKNVEIAALCDVDESRLKPAAEEFKVKRTYTDYRKMAQDKDLDAVSIAVPNFLHLPITLEFLEAGKDVLVEKPMARTAEEAEKMVRKAKETKRLLMVNMNHRWLPHFSALKKMAVEKKFGEIYYIRSRWLRNSTFSEEMKKTVWFANKEKSGGGTLLDLGVHILDLGLWVMDDFQPVSVSATVQRKFYREVDDFASALIRFKDDKVLQLETSWETHRGDEFAMTVLGTKAGAETLPSLRVYTKESGVPCETTFRLPESSAESSSISHFVECVTKKKSPEPAGASGEKGMLLVRILKAIYQSAETGKEVRL